MGASRRYPPNRRLTWSRLQRGWGYDELAAQVTASMKAQGEPDTGLTGNTVRRWETGERWPEPRFRKHLVILFDQTASDLGLLTPEELATRPDDNDPLDPSLRRLITTMVTRPKTDHLLSRQAFLRLLLGVGLLPEIAPLAALVEATNALGPESNRTSRLDQRSVTAYTLISTTQRQLYWSSPAAPLFEASLGHTQLGLELLRDTGAGPVRTQLADAVGHSALLSARLAFFDLGQMDVAKRWLDLAEHVALEAADHTLAAALYGHMAFIPGFAGDLASALAALDAAQRHIGYTDGSPGVRSWLYCVNAEITTRTGDPKTGVTRVRQAEDALATNGADPAWLDFYDSARLAGFAGYAQLSAGKHGEAAATLESALAGLAPSATKQQSVLLLDLATAYAPLDAPHAVELVDQAIVTLQHDAYAIAHERIPVVRAALRDTSSAAELDERTATLS